MRELYVVTHPQSTHHVDRLVGGWYDSDLTDLGLEQAARIGRRLRERIPRNVPVEIHSSDLKRTARTAEVIARLFDAPIATTADLREKSYGEAEGRPQAWLDDRFVLPPRVGDRMDHWEGIAGAETRRQVAQRIYRAMDRLLARPGSHQIIVTHGGALTFVVAAWIGMPLDAASYVAVRPTSGGITHLAEDDVSANRAIISLNDTAHLD